MQVQQLLQQQFGPGMEVVGSQYPPAPWRQALAQVRVVASEGQAVRGRREGRLGSSIAQLDALRHTHTHSQRRPPAAAAAAAAAGCGAAADGGAGRGRGGGEAL
jgi:hypothetical protein